MFGGGVAGPYITRWQEINASGNTCGKQVHLSNPLLDPSNNNSHLPPQNTSETSQTLGSKQQQQKTRRTKIDACLPNAEYTQPGVDAVDALLA